MNFILGCVAALLFGAMACMTYLSGRPGDHSTVYVILTGVVTAALPILVAIGKVLVNGKVQEMQNEQILADGKVREGQNNKIIQQLNGHTELLREQANTVGRAEGLAQGNVEGRAAEVKDQGARDDRLAATNATNAAQMQMQAAETQTRAADVQAQAAGIVPSSPGVWTNPDPLLPQILPTIPDEPASPPIYHRNDTIG